MKLAAVAVMLVVVVAAMPETAEAQGPYNPYARSAARSATPMEGAYEYDPYLRKWTYKLRPATGYIGRPPVVAAPPIFRGRTGVNLNNPYAPYSRPPVSGYRLFPSRGW